METLFIAEKLMFPGLLSALWESSAALSCQGRGLGRLWGAVGQGRVPGRGEQSEAARVSLVGGGGGSSALSLRQGLLPPRTPPRCWPGSLPWCRPEAVLYSVSPLPGGTHVGTTLPARHLTSRVSSSVNTGNGVRKPLCNADSKQPRSGKMIYNLQKEGRR